MKSAYLFEMVLALCVIPSIAFGGVYAECHGDSVRVMVSITGTADYSEMESLVVVGSSIGVCSGEVVVSPKLVTYPETGETQSYEFTIAEPFPNLYCRYEVMAVDSGGGFHSIPFYPMISAPTYHYFSCSGALALRGAMLIGDLQYVCPDQCWPSSFHLDWGEWSGPGEIESLIGIYDFFGEFYYETMLPQGLYLRISSTEAVTDPDGCNAVAIETMSWGGLKARYR